MFWRFQHKGDYEGDTNEKNRNSDDSGSDIKKNLDKEHKYKEYDECKEYSSMVAKTNESKRRKSRLR